MLKSLQAMLPMILLGISEKQNLLKTDRHPNRPTDICKTINPVSFKEGTLFKKLYE
jgi:hypothetical protein